MERLSKIKELMPSTDDEADLTDPVSLQAAITPAGRIMTRWLRSPAGDESSNQLRVPLSDVTISAMLPALNACPDQRAALSRSVPSCPVLSCPVLCYPILFYPILSYPILSYPILS